MCTANTKAAEAFPQAYLQSTMQLFNSFINWEVTRADTKGILN